MKRFKATILLALIITTNTLVAQIDFRPGYIITLQGDTISGSINNTNEGKLNNQCIFKPSSGNITVYTADSIIGYRFTDSKYYVSKEFKGERKFFEYLINGKLNIYLLKENFTTRYFLDKNDVSLVEIPLEEKIVRRDNLDYSIPPNKHFGILKHHTQEAPELVKKIDSLTKPSEKDLIKLAQQYHNIVCTDEQCIIYERKKTKIKVDLEITGNMIWVIADEINVGGLGVLANIGLNKYNERLFVRTGLLYSRIPDEQVKINLFRFPLQVLYLFNTKIVQPKLGVGGTLHLINEEHDDRWLYMNSIMVGANVNISKSFSLACTIDLNFKLLDVSKPFLSMIRPIGFPGASISGIIHF